MEMEILNKKYQLSLKLGVCSQISKSLNRPYMKVVHEIQDLDIEELTKIIYCAILNKEEIKYEDFRKEIMDSESLGVSELYKKVLRILTRLQKPSLTDEEFDKKVEEETEKVKNETIEKLEM